MEGNNKVFSQEEVNNIVQERLAKEKAKYEKALAEKDAEYIRKERKLKAREEIINLGLPTELHELVSLESDEAFNHSLELIKGNYKKEDKREPTLSGRTPDNRGHATPPERILEGGIRQAMGLAAK